jgi:hypothetical protein
VPADFDLAALVVGELRDPDTHQLAPISEERARRAAAHALATYTAGEGEARLSAMRGEYQAKKSALYAVLDASPMDAQGKAGARALLDGFYAALAGGR